MRRVSYLAGFVLLSHLWTFSQGPGPNISVHLVPADSSGDRLDWAVTYRSIATGAEYDASSGNGFRVSMPWGTYLVTVSDRSSHGAALYETLKNISGKDELDGTFKIDTDHYGINIGDFYETYTTPGACDATMPALADLELRVWSAEKLKNKRLEGSFSHFCAAITAASKLHTTVSDEFVSHADAIEDSGGSLGSVLLRASASFGLETDQLIDAFREGKVVAFLKDGVLYRISAIQCFEGSGPDCGNGVFISAWGSGSADFGVPEASHYVVIILGAEEPVSTPGPATFGHSLGTSASPVYKVRDSPPSSSHVKLVSQRLLQRLAAVRATFEERSRSLRLIETKNGRKTGGDFFLGSNLGQRYYSSAALLLLAGEVKEDLAKAALDLDLFAISDYVAAKFSAAGSALKPQDGLVSEEVGRKFIDEVGAAISKVQKTAAIVAVDLDVSSKPIGAEVRLITRSGHFRSVITDGPMPNVYRGLYTYHIEHEGAKPGDGDIDLVDDDGTLLHCVLSAAAESGRSYCSLHR